MRFKEVGDDRRHVFPPETEGRIDAQKSLRHRMPDRDALLKLFEIIEDAPPLLEIQFALISERNASRRSI